MGSRTASGVLIAAATAVVLAGGAVAAPCAPGVVEVRGAQGITRFAVELADDATSRARGLMDRPSLPSAAGMLFVYDAPTRATFWMKNTLIPLDMIFVDAAGVVQMVHANAIPHDETAIDGGPGVLAVLEINGGLAAALGIGPGAVLRHPAFTAGPAAWPCE